MKYLIVACVIIATLFLTACQADACPEGSVTYQEDVSLFPLESKDLQLKRQRCKSGEK